MANIEVHPPIFPIMQIKQSGSYITHSAWFFYKFRRLSDNVVVFSCLANSQPFGANNHPTGSYIQLAPGMYEWEVCNLTKSRAILQAFIMRSDSNNQGDGVVSAGGSNNPKNAVCYSQIHGGKRTYINFEVKEYAPGGTQWYHINLSYWFINGTGDAYTLDAPNDTPGFYTTDISTVGKTDNGTNLSWDNPEVFGPVALIPNSEKIATSLGDVVNPFYIPGTTPPPTTGPVVTLPAGKMLMFDAFNLFSKFFFTGLGGSLFRRNNFAYQITPGAASLNKYGEIATGKKAWYKEGELAKGFVGIPEDLKYSNAVPNQLIVRHGETTGIQLYCTIGNLPYVDYANSKYGIFIQKLSSAGDITVKLLRDVNTLLNVTLSDTNPHFYEIPFGVNGVGMNYNTWLTITKGSLAFNADNLVSVGFSSLVNFTADANLGYLDTEYRQFDRGVVEFEDCEDPSDIGIGVCYYPVPDYIPGSVFDDVVWLGTLQDAFPIEVDLDSFYIMVRKISTNTLIATLKYPEDTV